MEAEIPGAPTSSERLPWYALATLAALLPAVGAELAVQRVTDVFRGMAITGSGGLGSTFMGISEANHPLLFTTVAAAVLSAWLGIAVIRKPQRAAVYPGLLFSLAPLLACVPALLLWVTESSMLHVLQDQDTRASTIGDTSQRIANLVIATAGAPAVIIPIVLAALAVALARRRPRTEPGLPPAVFWAAVTVVLLGIAAAFYVRSSNLSQAAFAGHL